MGEKMSEESTPQSSAPRRVVTGVGSNGKATIIDDGPPKASVQRPTGTLVVEMWRSGEVPAAVSDDRSLTNTEMLGPPSDGVVVCVTTFPPDSQISPEAAAEYAAQMSAIYGDQGAGDGPVVPGMHSTETIDVMTMLEGELYMVMEDGETRLQAGDTVVQRGTRHAWQNRSDRPAKVVSTMMAATRP
jgi:mannose-6-phosphate isomerase-like protein (cupin superfamily)